MTKKTKNINYKDPITLENEFFKHYKEYKCNNSHLIKRWWMLLFLFVFVIFSFLLLILFMLFRNILFMKGYFICLAIFIVIIVMNRISMRRHRNNNNKIDKTRKGLNIIYSCFKKCNLNHEDDYQYVKQMLRNSIDETNEAFDFCKIVFPALVSFVVASILSNKEGFFECLKNIIVWLGNKLSIQYELVIGSDLDYYLCIASLIFLLLFVFFYWPKILSRNQFWKKHLIIQIDEFIFYVRHNGTKCLSEIEPKLKTRMRVLATLRDLFKKMPPKIYIYIQINNKVIIDNRNNNHAKISTKRNIANNKS